MKKILLVLIGIITVPFHAQVIIDPGTKSTVTNASVSLEFGDHQNKGLVLPYVAESVADANSAVAGTLIMDPMVKKIKLKLSSGVWLDMSNGAAITNAVETDIQDNKQENLDAKVYIGNNPQNNTKNGILVLGDSDKALILPKVASPHLNIINPAAGMIVYDTRDKQLAIFNGTHWSFLKP